MGLIFDAWDTDESGAGAQESVPRSRGVGGREEMGWIWVMVDQGLDVGIRWLLWCALRESWRVRARFLFLFALEGGDQNVEKRDYTIGFSLIGDNPKARYYLLSGQWGSPRVCLCLQLLACRCNVFGHSLSKKRRRT